MQKTERREPSIRLEVVCTWCGGLIRHSDKKASCGMCLPCFARMMREHSRAHQSAAGQPGASLR